MAGKYTEAQKKASQKYDSRFETIRIRVTPEQKIEYIRRAEASGKSLTQYVIECIEKGIE
jgi:predicted HicB family RNase H-like nuclease